MCARIFFTSCSAVSHMDDVSGVINCEALSSLNTTST